jgi:TRAP-type C4-dicarboxylate transport system substrate-binding protein
MTRETITSTRRSLLTGTAAAATAFFIGGRARAQEPEFKLKLATVAPTGTPWSEQLNDVKKRVQDGSGGRIKIKAYLGGALGGEVETLERCKKGTVHLWGGTAGALSTKIPEFGCFELPYLFPTLQHADKVIDGLRLQIEGLLWKNGLKLLFASENGRRSIGTKFGFVKNPSDLKGKKMRAQQSDVHINTWRALGASPVPIAVTEVLTSLQTGAVDGFDNTELFTFAGSWYQAITHFTLTRHAYQPGFVVASRSVWESLPADLQALLMGDPQAEAERGRKDIRRLEPALVQNFENAGIAVHESTRDELDAFARATRKTHETFEKDYPGAGAKLLASIYSLL